MKIEFQNIYRQKKFYNDKSYSILQKKDII